MLFKFLYKLASLIGCLVIVALVSWIAVSAVEIWVHNTLVDLGIEHTYNAINFFTPFLDR